MEKGKQKLEMTAQGSLLRPSLSTPAPAAMIPPYSSLAWYQTMFAPEQRGAFIHELGQQIGTHFYPEKVILFGSQAYGEPTPDSDIDLLVVMNYQGRHTVQALKILTQLKSLAPIDLLVRTPVEVQERLVLGDQFMQEIIERGKVIYENNHEGMDR